MAKGLSIFILLFYMWHAFGKDNNKILRTRFCNGMQLSRFSIIAQGQHVLCCMYELVADSVGFQGVLWKPSLQKILEAVFYLDSSAVLINEPYAAPGT